MNSFQKHNQPGKSHWLAAFAANAAVFVLAVGLLSGVPCLGQSASGSKTPAGRVVMAKMSQKDLRTGLNWYVSQYKTISSPYEFNAQQLCLVADSLIRKDRVPDAVEVLKINAKMYSDSRTAYTALGNACVLSGDNALAITAFEKSQALGEQDEKVKHTLHLLKNADGSTPYYVCAPCACTSHHLRFIHKGKCPACAMALLEKKADVKK